MMRTILIAALIALSPTAALARDKPLFAARDMLHLSIQGSIPAIRGTSATEATLGVEGPAPETLPIKLTARGITRRQADVCQFPPLRIEFTQKPGEGSLFDGQRKLKLVTHCRPAPAFQQYQLLEYAAYRMYELLTPLSFRARLATIDYRDARGKPTITRTGFLIEDTDDVAGRAGMREVKAGDKVPVSTISPPDAARDTVFQYLIGNLDWAINAGPQGAGCCHNVKLIAPENAVGGRIPVPYDYDFSGLVDAPYATPPEGVPVANVRVHRYRGFCAHNPQVHSAIAAIRARHDALLAVLDDVPGLDPRVRTKALAYLAIFFDQTKDAAGVDRILKTCL